MKDWTGNSKSTFVTLGASSHSDGEREINDFYSTDPNTLKIFLNKLKEDSIELHSEIWECACGMGHLSKVLIDGEEITDFSTQLESGFNLQSYDINSNTWNPYSNIDCSVSLYQQLNESVASISGIPIYSSRTAQMVSNDSSLVWGLILLLTIFFLTYIFQNILI